jgi:hypothetical protein
MREIFKRRKGKDFYRDSLEYMEYDPDAFEQPDNNCDYYPDDDEISYYIIVKHKMSKE